MVRCSACVQNVQQECGERCQNGYINCRRTPPRCMNCNKCSRDKHLVEVQSCSSHSPAVCQCQAGYYCQTVLENTCGRCARHRECPPGQGVKQRGTPEKDTECEACPHGSYSNTSSATEGCRTHTDCEKLQLNTSQRGGATTDTICGEQPATASPVPMMLSSDGSAGEGKEEELSTAGVLTYPAHREGSTPTSPLTTTATEGVISRWGGGLVAVAVLCLIALVGSLSVVCTKKRCGVKLWLQRKKGFILSDSGTNQLPLLAYKEAGNKLLQREKTLPCQSPTPETSLRIEGSQTEQPADDTMHGKHPAREHLNNRIEKIYIMNADTVLVGSISEASSRPQRPAVTDADSREGPEAWSRYPQQESSKEPEREDILSVEEEEGEAKLILEI